MQCQGSVHHLSFSLGDACKNYTCFLLLVCLLGDIWTLIEVILTVASASTSVLKP